MSGSEIAELFKRDNGNVHRAAAKIIVPKSRAARGSVCNVLLSGSGAGLASFGCQLFMFSQRGLGM